MPSRKYAKYPPEVASVEILGYVKDSNNVQYSRDIGRSSKIGRFYVYQFGDTFCFNRAGDFVGMTDNTCAVIPEPSSEPTSCVYRTFEGNEKVSALVPLTNDERFLPDEGHLMKLWSFGGIIEDSHLNGYGWVFFEKGECVGKTTLPYGTGVARVNIDGAGTICAYRDPDLLFEADEPRFGVFSSLSEGSHYYLWGHHGTDILLARVPHTGHNAAPVMDHMQHGAIYKSGLFGPGKGTNYVFIGINSWADSQVVIGVAAQREGPFEFKKLFEAEGIEQKEGYKYCIYPHPWAFDEEKGELMVTWSEHWPGGVVAAKVKFEMTAPWFCKTMPINHLRSTIRNHLQGGQPLLQLSVACNVNAEVRGRYYAPGFAAHNGQEKPLHLWVEGASWYDVELAVARTKQGTKKWEGEAAADVKRRAAEEVSMRALEERREEEEKAMEKERRRRASGGARLLRQVKKLTRRRSETNIGPPDKPGVSVFDWD
ncbi:MAG: hypothetical protein M1812_004424 [Candelaria pacifica]|nr:MAG: hypothetical protein M1812_004424 [Candelaria pacifica]